MKQLEGIITAILTATDDQGRFDEKRMRNLVEHSIGNGMKGLFVFGSAGEFYAFSEEEKSQILDIVIDQANGRIPIIAGCGAETTREAIRLCEMAHTKNIDYISCITPYYIAPTQDDIYEHYKALNDSSDIPLIVYHLPVRTGVNIEFDTLQRISQLPHIAGIKDSSGDLAVFKQYMTLDSDDFQVMIGIDTLMLTAFQLGARAAVSAPSNAVGKVLNELYENYRAGNIEKAQSIQNKMLIFKKVLQMSPAPTIVKSAANLLGIPVGIPQKPLHEPSPEIQDEVLNILHMEFENCFTTS